MQQQSKPCPDQPEIDCKKCGFTLRADGACEECPAEEEDEEWDENPYRCRSYRQQAYRYDNREK